MLRWENCWWKRSIDTISSSIENGIRERGIKRKYIELNFFPMWFLLLRSPMQSLLLMVDPVQCVDSVI